MLDAIDRSIYLLEQSLNLRMARQNVIAANLANVETPGYRALDVNFEEVLRDIASRLDAEGSPTEAGTSLQPVHLELRPADASSLGNDNNTVDLERELGKLSENALMFKAQALFLGKKLAMLREAIGSSQQP